MPSIKLIKNSLCAYWLLAALFIPPVLALGQKPDEPLITLNDCWHYPSADLMSIAPASDRTTFYVAERGGRVSALSLQNGTRIWSTELGGELRSNVVAVGQNIFVAAGPVTDGKPGHNAHLRALSSATGVPGVDIPLPSSENVRLVGSGRRVVVLAANGYAAAYDAASPNVTAVWQRNFSGLQIDSALVWGDKIVLAAGDHKIHVIDITAGSDVVAVPTKTRVSTLGVIDDDIVWGDDHGELIRYDLRKNAVYWRFKNGARISGLAQTDDGVVAASLDNFVYLVSSYYGSVRWKRRLAGRLSGITSNNKDLAVVQVVGEPNAVLLNLQNGKSVGQVSVGDESFILPAVFASDRFIFVTNRQVDARSAGPCEAK